MKYILIFSFISFSSLSFGKGINTSVDNLLRVIGFEKFCDNLSKVKDYKTTEDIKSFDYELRYFFKHIKPWSFFDENNFSEQFKQKLISSFSRSELDQLAVILKNPFRLKILNASILYRDLFAFYEDLYDENLKTPVLASSRKVLLQNIYLVHGMDIQKDFVQNKLKLHTQSKKLQVSVIKDGKPTSHFVDTKRLKLYLEKPELFIISELANDLKGFRHYELREYLRLIKGDKLTQRFTQLFVNFHFLYISKYIYKVSTDKIIHLNM